MITHLLSASIEVFKKTSALLRICILCSLIPLVLTACSSETAPTVGEATDFARACEQANEGKRIAVTGYLRLPDSFTGDASVVLRLYATDDFSGSPIGVQTRFGTEPNQLEQVPNEYQDADLQVYLSDGSIANFGTPVKVSGKVYFP